MQYNEAMIRITAPLLILFITAVFLFLAATNIQGGWLYLVDALLWSVVAMSFILPLLQLRRMRIRRNFPPVVYAEQNTSVEIEVEAPGRLPLAFVNLEDQAAEHLPSGQTLPPHGQKGFITSLRAGQSTRYRYHFCPPQAGLYRFKTLRTGSFGPLGLMGIYWNQPLLQGLVVRPVQPTQSLKLFSDEQQAAMQQARQQVQHNQDISHFREYQPGDSKRSIHWKNTAKRQKLIVSEAREEPFQQISLLFDTHTEQNPEIFQRMQQSAIQVCHALLEQNMEIHCFAPAADPQFWQKMQLSPPQRQVRAARNWDDLSYWLGALATDAPETLEEALRSSGFQAQVIILIAGELSSPLQNYLLHEQQGSGTHPITVFSQAAAGSRDGMVFKALLGA